MLRFASAILWKMGILFIVVSALSGLVLMALILLPADVTARLQSELMAWLNPYKPYPADEFVHDYSLSEDVPRIYYVSIPRLGLHAPVVPVSPRAAQVDGRAVAQIHVPNAFAVGWSILSAPVGQPGNTVFVGHNNEYGEVFKNLWDLESGDEVVVHTATGERRYRVTHTTMFQEKGRSLEERAENARWLAPSAGEQLTLITCWPYYTNTHRFVVTAVPAG